MKDITIDSEAVRLWLTDRSYDLAIKTLLGPFTGICLGVQEKRKLKLKFCSEKCDLQKR